ncbi:transducin beta-like protein 3 [Tanacetum coccineum]
MGCEVGGVVWGGLEVLVFVVGNGDLIDELEVLIVELLWDCLWGWFVVGGTEERIDGVNESKFMRWKGVRVTKASKRAKDGCKRHDTSFECFVYYKTQGHVMTGFELHYHRGDQDVDAKGNDYYIVLTDLQIQIKKTYINSGSLSYSSSQDRKSVNSEDEITELKDELEIGLTESPNSLKVVMDTSIRGTFASESIKTTTQIAVRVYDLASMSCSYVLAPADIVLCLDTYTRSYGRTLIVMGSKDNTVRLWNAKAEAALELEEVTNEALELMRLADGHLQDCLSAHTKARSFQARYRTVAVPIKRKNLLCSNQTLFKDSHELKMRQQLLEATHALFKDNQKLLSRIISRMDALRMRLVINWSGFCAMLHGLVINWSSSAIETSRNRVNGIQFKTNDARRSG